MHSKPQVSPGGRSLVALFVAFALVASACGQKSGVADSIPLSLGTGTDAGLGGAPEAHIVSTSTDGTITTATASGGDSPVGAFQAASTNTEAGGTPEAKSAYEPVEELIAAAEEPTGGSTVGVTDDTIRIGMHFPMTGTSPNPGAFNKDNFELYWNHLKKNEQKIFGRDVELEMRDDKTSPSGAADACRTLVEEDEVFLVIGYAYPALIQSCARTLAKLGVPYLAMGSAEAVLAPYPNHFSLSAPYFRQADTVVDLAIANLNVLNERNGLLGVAGGSKADVERPKAAMRARGVSIDHVRYVDAQPNPEELAQAALDMKERDIENIYFGASPWHFQYFMSAAERQGYHPQLFGSGLTVVHDGILKMVCGGGNQGQGSLYLHPFPGYSDRHRFDPEFGKAGGNDEFAWGQWGIAKAVGQILELSGRNLTRERLLWHLPRAKPIRTGVLPDIDYTLDDHFTDDGMHLVRAHCDLDQSRWRTIKPFIRLVK